MDGVHRQRSLHRHEAAQTGVAGFELHARQAVADGVGTRAAVAVQVHAEQPEFAELPGEFPGQTAGLEPVRDLGLEPGVDKLAHGGGDVALVLR